MQVLDVLNLFIFFSSYGKFALLRFYLGGIFFFFVWEHPQSPCSGKRRDTWVLLVFKRSAAVWVGQEESIPAPWILITI